MGEVVGEGIHALVVLGFPLLSHAELPSPSNPANPIPPAHEFPPIGPGTPPLLTYPNLSWETLRLGIIIFPAETCRELLIRAGNNVSQIIPSPLLRTGPTSDPFQSASLPPAWPAPFNPRCCSGQLACRSTDQPSRARPPSLKRMASQRALGRLNCASQLLSSLSTTTDKQYSPARALSVRGRESAYNLSEERRSRTYRGHFLPSTYTSLDGGCWHDVYMSQYYAHMLCVEVFLRMGDGPAVLFRGRSRPSLAHKSGDMDMTLRSCVCFSASHIKKSAYIFF